MLDLSANNMKWTYTGASFHFTDCIEFIWGTYSDVVVSYLHVNYFAYLEYMWHMRAIFAAVTSHLN